ncbi:MAG: plasmid pRiA4b ORF-3 family protein [Treponema sp.]|nr:plasmid pRiA4b ORF-3 family protein [Treponema sp.]
MASIPKENLGSAEPRRRVPVYQFHAELLGFKPKIWRRFQVISNATVARLGYIIQVLFEMTASHLMALEVPEGKNYSAYLKSVSPEPPAERALANEGSPPDESYNSLIFGIEPDLIRRYEIPMETYDPFEYHDRNVEIADATKVLLMHALSMANNKLILYYDFGDGWQIPITLEKIVNDKDILGRDLPRVLEGEGFGIVEDVGGIYGLTEMVKAYKKKKGSEYRHYREWLGIEDFDISSFNPDDMNFRLKKIPRMYKEIYEDNLMLTQKSIDIIKRKYILSGRTK